MSAPRAGRRCLWLVLYAVAMGLLEAAVVVYLRELYYPGGFRFPLVVLAPAITYVEIAREVCTLVMLLAVAVLASEDRHETFFTFGFLFGIWDLVYYAGLKLALDWPASWLTWDVLFLIPVPWVSPMLAPVVISLLLVAGFVADARARRRGRSIRLGVAEWAVAIVAGVLVILSLCWRFPAALVEPTLSGFPWPLFVAGALLGLAPFAHATRRALRGT